MRRSGAAGFARRADFVLLVWSGIKSLRERPPNRKSNFKRGASNGRLAFDRELRLWPGVCLGYANS